DGRFLLVSQDTADVPGATYFVASRYRGELYIGAPFQPPLPDGVDYTVQVGVPGTSASALLGAASEPAARPTLPGGSEPFPCPLAVSRHPAARRCAGRRLHAHAAAHAGNTASPARAGRGAG